MTAAAFSLFLPIYATSAGDSGHLLLECGLLLAGGALVFGELIELFEKFSDLADVEDDDQ